MHNYLVDDIYEQVCSRTEIITPDTLCRQGALYLLNDLHILFKEVEEQLLNENEL